MVVSVQELRFFGHDSAVITRQSEDEAMGAARKGKWDSNSIWEAEVVVATTNFLNSETCLPMTRKAWAVVCCYACAIVVLDRSPLLPKTAASELTHDYGRPQPGVHRSGDCLGDVCLLSSFYGTVYMYIKWQS